MDKGRGHSKVNQAVRAYKVSEGGHAVDMDQDQLFEAGQAQVFAGLGSDGRLAGLEKELKANEPVPELGEEEPLATEPVFKPRGAPVAQAELVDEEPEPEQGGDQQGGGVELTQETDEVTLGPETAEVNWDYGEDAHKGTDPGGQKRGNAKLDQEVVGIMVNTQKTKAKQGSQVVTGERVDVGVSIELRGAAVVQEANG